MPLENNTKTSLAHSEIPELAQRLNNVEVDEAPLPIDFLCHDLSCLGNESFCNDKMEFEICNAVAGFGRSGLCGN